MWNQIMKGTAKKLQKARSRTLPTGVNVWYSEPDTFQEKWEQEELKATKTLEISLFIKLNVLY